MPNPVDLYNNVYGDFASDAEAAVRRATYGQDIGQSSWMTSAEWLRFADMLQVQAGSHVLEVGSGSGGPAVFLGEARGCRVTGVDINEQYLRMARARYSGMFVQADLTTSELRSLGTFDTVLVNSFLHHVSDDAVRAILSRLATVLAPDGRVHILELVLPPRVSLARMMAKLDRGRYARPIERWCDLFAAAFEPVITEPYTFGGGLWAMVYFQGRVRQ